MSRIRSTSAWDEPQIDRFLSDTVIPIRLACMDRDGDPLVCSLWYLYADGVLWCATQQTASVVAMLEAKPRCGFEVAPETMPYRGVRGQGTVSLFVEQGAAKLEQLIDRYLGQRDSGFAAWLMTRSATEVAIRITPDWMTSWDFSQRMRN